jgi:hypothetical protein
MNARQAGVVLLTTLLGGCASLSTVPEVQQFDRHDPRRGTVQQSINTQPEGVDAQGAVLLRIIKEDHELELWRQQRDGAWILAKTYPICRFSGGLGPKRRQGDRQAPEGFYSITVSSLNPHSREHLSINTGYPNQFDRNWGYTGSDVMIHGGCSSAGCYAMTDASMEEIYAAVRDSARSGQQSVQLQIYPFRMTDWRMLGLTHDHNLAFWLELKRGWDWFESHRAPVPMTVSGRDYVLADRR